MFSTRRTADSTRSPRSGDHGMSQSHSGGMERGERGMERGTDREEEDEEGEGEGEEEEYDYEEEEGASSDPTIDAPSHRNSPRASHPSQSHLAHPSYAPHTSHTHAAHPAHPSPPASPHTFRPQGPPGRSQCEPEVRRYAETEHHRGREQAPLHHEGSKDLMHQYHRTGGDRDRSEGERDDYRERRDGGHGGDGSRLSKSSEHTQSEQPSRHAHTRHAQQAQHTHISSARYLDSSEHQGDRVYGGRPLEGRGCDGDCDERGSDPDGDRGRLEDGRQRHGADSRSSIYH